MGLPTIYFNMFEHEGEPGSFKAARATGTFRGRWAGNHTHGSGAGAARQRERSRRVSARG